MTVIEILVVVSIIALLVGLLLPAVHTVQKMAKETKQKAQFTVIELGLAAFKNDYGTIRRRAGRTCRAARPDYCCPKRRSPVRLGLLGFSDSPGAHPGPKAGPDPP
jgi:type II secretory pathway pseudopilin PulG